MSFGGSIGGNIGSSSSSQSWGSHFWESARRRKPLDLGSTGVLADSSDGLLRRLGLF